MLPLICGELVAYVEDYVEYHPDFSKESGFGWDDNLKMITCDAKTYEEEVMVWLSTIFCYYSIVLMLLRCVLSYVSKY